MGEIYYKMGRMDHFLKAEEAGGLPKKAIQII